MDELREAVVAAVGNFIRSNPDLSQSVTVAEFVVIAACIGWNTEGDEISQVTMIPDGALHRIGGLVNEAKVRIDAETVSNLSFD